MRAARLACAWAVGYGGWQAWWALGHRPSFGRFGTDLTVGSAWAAVGMCMAVGVVVAGLGGAFTGRRAGASAGAGALGAGARSSAGAGALGAGAGARAGRGAGPGAGRGWEVAGWLVAVGVFANCPMLLLDVVGGLLPGLGIPFDAAGFASRAACAAGGTLLARALVTHRRRRVGDCAACARADDDTPSTGTPRWAWWAAYGAIASCLVRIGAQVAVGFGDIPFETGVSMLLFEAGFLLAGSLLPLATVHSWGKVFPRWTPPLAGRRVPRWLVLGPALGLGGGLVVYFGVGLAQLAVESWNGTYDSDMFPQWFMWAAMTGYLLWGLGMGASALAYLRATRPRCARCGRA
ncbi:hypothetical protein R8Z50_25320 [Longispora sp. K20-0274]|uniref:hypothetical protein n=1 Tax=Longispora sp. K20-0274 TaxID=3088255 RepID=UPI00399BA507